MSKFVNVPNGDYKISVQDGGEITLNTGFNQGTVYITGNLVVQGESTDLQTTELIVEDRVIELNKGDDTAAGIQGTDRFSGIRINRGQLPDAYFGYDEDTSSFIMYDNNNSLVALRTDEISTGGGDLTFNFDGGNGVAQVAIGQSANDYEKRIFGYDLAGNITGTVLEPDGIPNTQALVDWVDYNFANVFLRQIGDGTTSVTSITIDDEENTGNPSVITFSIDAVPVSQLYADRWEFDELRFVGTQIETTTSNTDLVLSSSGTGTVRINDTLEISNDPDPIALDSVITPTSSIKIMSREPSTGKSGLFFVNKNNDRDEIISKNRSLLFSMIF